MPARPVECSYHSLSTATYYEVTLTDYSKETVYYMGMLYLHDDIFLTDITG